MKVKSRKDLLRDTAVNERRFFSFLFGLDLSLVFEENSVLNWSQSMSKSWSKEIGHFAFPLPLLLLQQLSWRNLFRHPLRSF